MRLTALLFALASGAAAALPVQDEAPVTRVAFGSCFKTDGPPEVWEAVEGWEPQLLILLGDNVYADTRDMEVMRARYAELDAVPAFARLRSQATLLATWDDHDYGANDAGAEYPMRAEARDVFLDFLGEPPDSERRRTPGVYGARTFGPPGRRLQVILLDTRTFRGPLDRKAGREPAVLGRPGHYRPAYDPERTMLGEAQWAWLRERLLEPAELRLVASSIQFVAEDHGFEKWNNLPLERQRMLELVRETGAGGVLFLSGDRHRAELSILDPARAERDSAVDVGYRVIDITASSFNAPSEWWNERNRHRVGSTYFQANFGTVTIEWEAPAPRVTLTIHSDVGRPMLRHDVLLEELRAPDNH